MNIDEQGQRMAAIADEVRRATLAGGWARERSAIASCRIGVEVYQTLGHRVAPLAVAAGFYSARSAATDGAEGHSIGVAGTGVVNPADGRWDGHLVLIVDNRWLVDPSADQFSRPTQGIDIEQPIILHLGPGGAGQITADQPVTARRPDGLLLSYRRMREPGDWRRAADWSGNGPQAARAVLDAVTALRRSAMGRARLDDDLWSCRVCRIALAPIDNARTGERLGYEHTREWEQGRDHEPQPILTRELSNPDELCDFCAEPGPVWRYVGRNIEGTRLLRGEPVDGYHGEQWAACDVCDRFVTAVDLAGLLRSVERTRRYRREHAGLPQHVRDAGRAGKLEVWREYIPSIRLRRRLHPAPPPKLAPRLLPRIHARLVRLLTERGPLAFGQGALEASPQRPVLMPLGEAFPDAGPAAPAATQGAFYELYRVTDGQARRFTDAAIAGLRAAGDENADELYHVSAQFTAMALGAARDLPDFTVTAEELPAPFGLLIWETPVYAVDSADPDGIPADVIACSWRTVPGGVWLTLYTQPEQSMIGEDPAVVRAQLGYLTPLSAGGGLSFGTSAQTGDAADEMLRIILATWFLIMQPGVADVDIQQVGDGKQRRRAARAGRTLPRVKVVDLRRQQRGQAAGRTSGGGWHVSVRFIVRGHWRRQAYGPGRSLRRSMYIAPFLKGPDSAPLKTERAPTVKVLR